jgi:hypothetical protein
MNMEEYAYERGPKSTQDISSCSKGSSYEEEEDEERYASNEVEEDGGMQVVKNKLSPY